MLFSTHEYSIMASFLLLASAAAIIATIFIRRSIDRTVGRLLDMKSAKERQKGKGYVE